MLYLLTPQALSRFAPHCDAARIAPLLDAQLEAAEINSGLRLSAFLAQAAIETAYFTEFVENLNYSAQGLLAEWPQRFEGVAGVYAHQPVRIANRAYGSTDGAVKPSDHGYRMGNGPESSGDGWKFRGRGFFDHTGHDDYALLTKLITLPLLDNPDLLLDLGNAAVAAAAFWTSIHGNALADGGSVAELTRAVNGGLNGLAARQLAFEAARKIWNG